MSKWCAVDVTVYVACAYVATTWPQPAVICVAMAVYGIFSHVRARLENRS